MKRAPLTGLSLLTLTLLAFAWANQTFFAYMPVISKMPTLTPTRTATATPTPTATPTSVPCPAGTPVPVSKFYTSQNKVVGQAFRLQAGQSNCVTPGQDVWFYFEAKNLPNTTFRVGGLGAIWCTNKTGGQCTQASWGDFNWGWPEAEQVIAHEDHLNISVSGTYQVRLGVCWLASRTDCENNPASWEYLSDPLTVVVR